MLPADVIIEGRTVRYTGLVNGGNYKHEVRFHFDTKADAQAFATALEEATGVEVTSN